MPYPETIAYIKKQLEKGISVDKVRKALLESGYQQEVIDELIEKAGAKKEEKKSSGIEVILKDVAIGVFLLLVFGSLFYFSFLKDVKVEKFAPNTIKTDFSKKEGLELQQDGFYNLKLSDYVKDKNYDVNSLRWSFEGNLCINIQIEGENAVLRSVFLPDCPVHETIVFTAVNPEGQSASGALEVDIVG
jgi:hypothetical protein